MVLLVLAISLAAPAGYCLSMPVEGNTPSVCVVSHDDCHKNNLCPLNPDHKAHTQSLNSPSHSDHSKHLCPMQIRCGKSGEKAALSFFKGMYYISGKPELRPETNISYLPEEPSARQSRISYRIDRPPSKNTLS
ncbi:MAG: hypothetical protein HY887_02070 [Deltaproteobacteria bacterium]|nr:hypothetical protein [Deltaproteobacteria bacterium]